jgi:hypothetical protein
MEPIAQTIAETCLYIGFKRTKVFDLIRTGRLQKVKVDGKTLVTVASAKALIEQSLVKKGEV